MKRFRLLLVSSCAACWIAAAFCGASRAWGQTKPNVILLETDDAGYADFGFMNPFTGATTEFKTPNLDALASQSKVFTNAYQVGSICSVSRAGMITGRMPQRYNFEYNVVESGSAFNGVPGTEFTMAEALKQVGYRTSLMGKWHLGFEASQLPLAQGYDYFYGIQGGIRPYFGVGPSVFRNSTILGTWYNEPSINNIPRDPTYGRMFTDAISDEATLYISQNANQADPFFMHVAFSAPHEPYDKVKATDLAEFESSSLVGYRKNAAALTKAMDRAVGLIMERLNDPNWDGDPSDSIAGNTIIAFTNDNGGALPLNDPNLPQPNATLFHDNGPLRGYKSLGWEGGLRVPMFIKAPGVTAGVSNETVSGMDLMPTFLAAAGAPPAPDLDGRDLSAVLQDAQVGPLHDSLVWRAAHYYFAIRKGDWKLVKGTESATPTLYHLNPDGSGEIEGHNTTEPAIYRSMLNEFVDWEATIGKPTQRVTGLINRFDVFRFNQNLKKFSGWRDIVWQDDANPGAVVGINREDPYANAGLVFMPRNDADYTTTNNISRSTGHWYPAINGGLQSVDGLKEFMLNELRFEGDFSGMANRQGTLLGFPLMVVKNLSGVGPRMTVATTSSVASSFSFNFNMDVVLHADLEITGDGTQPFTMNGQIRDFDEARSLTKTGTSTIKLTGNNIYSGDTIVNGGALRIDGPNAALASTSSLQIGAQGSVSLIAGRIHTPLIQVAPGGTFNFTGGVLDTTQVDGNLTNTGGTFRPGLAVGDTSITGNFTQAVGGTLTMEIGGVGAGFLYDRLFVGDAVALDGALQVVAVDLGGELFDPLLGSTFEIIQARNALTGTFSSVSLPALPISKKWEIEYSTLNMVLRVVARPVIVGLTADFDHNNTVNDADLVIWRNSMGVDALGDADFDGDTDGDDFLYWQRQLTQPTPPETPPEVLAARVPEPASAVLLAAAVFAWPFGRRACRLRRSARLAGLSAIRHG